MCREIIWEESNTGLQFCQSCHRLIFTNIHPCHWVTFSLWFVPPGRTTAGRSNLLISDWSEEDVSAWLQEEGLGGLVDKFRANDIDGTELLRLTKETLASELHIGETNTRCSATQCRSGRLLFPRSYSSRRIKEITGSPNGFCPPCRNEEGHVNLCFLCPLTRIKHDTNN